MRTRIISAFPGTGKTYFYNKYSQHTLDSDSSLFSWIETSEGKVRNPDFPNNYISHIKENIGKYEFILVSSHKEVRDALVDNCLFFYLIYPGLHKKENYIKRYQDRGNSGDFIKLLDSKFEDWIKECFNYTIGCKNIYMCSETLEQEIIHITASEEKYK